LESEEVSSIDLQCRKNQIDVVSGSNENTLMYYTTESAVSKGLL